MIETTSRRGTRNDLFFVNERFVASHHQLTTRFCLLSRALYVITSRHLALHRDAHFIHRPRSRCHPSFINQRDVWPLPVISDLMKINCRAPNICRNKETRTRLTVVGTCRRLIIFISIFHRAFPAWDLYPVGSGWEYFSNGGLEKSTPRTWGVWLENYK